MTTIGERLREERSALGMSQTAFGEVGGVLKGAQIKYESGERFPDAAYLAAVARAGVDVRYVVTGERGQPVVIPAEEQRLLSLFRLAEASVRQAVLRALATGEEPGKSAKLAPLPNVTIHGDVGQKIDGPMVISGGQSFSMGGSAPAKKARKPRGG